MGFLTHLYESELSNKAKLVYMYLRDRSGKKNFCYPSIKTIAKELNISSSTVQRALKELEKAKLIQKERRYRENGSNTSNNLIIVK